MVKRLRRRPLTAKTGVRVPMEVPPRDSDIDTISGSFLLHFFRDRHAKIKGLSAGIGVWRRGVAGFRFYESNVQFASKRIAGKIGR